MASNKRRRHTPDQIIRKLAEGNKPLGAGQELAEVCRHLEVTESTWQVCVSFDRIKHWGRAASLAE